MHTVLCNLLAALLSIHALLGCCWHHAHLQACCSDRQVFASDECAGEAHGSTCCHESSEAEHGDQAPHPKKGEECPGSCTYLSVARTNVDCDFGLSLSLIATCSLATPDAVGVSATAWEQDFGSAQPAPPLRLHLLHQLLLI